MSKRKLEFSEYDKVQEEVVTSLSPLKKSRAAGSQYYDGEVCDGTEILRFVGFSSVQKKQLDDSCIEETGYLSRLPNKKINS